MDAETKTQHTPGPWVIEELGGNSILRLRVASESNACDVADLNCDRSDEEAVSATRADAVLISLAPEMFELLSKLEEQARQVVHGERTHIDGALWTKAQQLLLRVQP